jgi:hypothetical protein
MAPQCPKALILERLAANSNGYKKSPRVSPLASWDKRASVRVRPHPTLRHEPDGLLFPTELVPVASHEIVEQAPESVRTRILASHLYRYLHFTAKLEHLVVNRTLLAVANDVTGLEVPDWMRLDAYKIYCDEAYHAFVAADLAAAVAKREGVETPWTVTPYFIRRLGEIVDAAGPELGPLVEILFVVCSETLISNTLNHAVGAPGLSSVVRQALDDHAHDERRHHAYFAEFLRCIWVQLTPLTQRRAGVIVPDLIDAFLRPDLDGCREEFCGYGFSRDEIEQILAESYTDEVLRVDRQHIARHTVRYFEEVGALEHAEVADAFGSADLCERVAVDLPTSGVPLSGFLP